MVTPAAGGPRSSLKEFRRGNRVLIAAGGADYMEELARSLNADQRADDNTLPAAIAAADVMVVPVLLESVQKESVVLGNAQVSYRGTEGQPGDRNFDLTRADGVIAFPIGDSAWAEYLQPGAPYPIPPATRQLHSLPARHT
jgi:hypothetical protein